MAKLKIYLDSSVPSAYYDERKPFRQKVTQKWWQDIMHQKYEVYISPITDAELSGTKDDKKRKCLQQLVKDIALLEVSEESVELADTYIEYGIIPEEYRNDALHIAVAAVQGMDIVVSWNFKHLVNPETRRKVKGVNVLKSYKEIDIASPEELGGDEYE